MLAELSDRDDRFNNDEVCKSVTNPAVDYSNVQLLNVNTAKIDYSFVSGNGVISFLEIFKENFYFYALNI